MRDRIKAVTEADVLRVAKAYLKESNRTLATFIPTKSPDRAEIPATPDIAATFKDFKGSAVVAAGEAFDPSPANIESRVVRSTLPERHEDVAALTQDPRRHGSGDRHHPLRR